MGTFDGVHIGHLKVIKDLVKNASQNNASSILLTFFPHPRMVLNKTVNIKLINTLDERIQLLKKTGLDVLIIHEFTKEFSEQTAFNFVRSILVDKLNIAELIIGYDHQFGQNREGDFKHLKSYGKLLNFKVKEISKLDVDNFAVSSTLIRKAIKNGQIEKANNYLGYNYLITGKVVKGKNLGQKIGFPTANIQLQESYKLLPKTGAYVVKSQIENKTIFGMMNIGYRPTVSGEKQTIEIHFFDFNKDLYGTVIQIDVLAYLRDEQKFDSIKLLTNQLQEDKQNSLEIIGGTFFDL
jgi:riboflavin kinase/FMN adenylyltransferase